MVPSRLVGYVTYLHVYSMGLFLHIRQPLRAESASSFFLLKTSAYCTYETGLVWGAPRIIGVVFIASKPPVTFGVAGNVVHHQVCTMVALHRSIVEIHPN